MDMTSFILGMSSGSRSVVLEEGGDYTFADENEDGNIVIEEAE